MKKLFTLLLIVVATVSFAQQKTISGVVSDENGLPLPGATILVKGTTNGTSTNFDGEYTITAHLGDILSFAYLGYVSQEVVISEKNEINISMQLDDSLDEVVVTALGIKKSASSISRKKESISESLSGRVPGLAVETIDSEVAVMSKDKDQNQIKHGQLTAGEIRDVKKWEEWLAMQQESQIQYINKTYGFGFTKPIIINVSDKNCEPLANIQVKLFNEDLKLIMSSRTDLKGQTYVFKDAFNAKPSNFYTIQVINKGKITGRKITNSFKENIDFKLESTQVSNAVDIMFTIDATGSMGDEMNYLKAELANIFDQIDASVETKRLALTFYRDKGDAYITKPFNFSSDISFMQGNLRAQNAGGGGDYEEAVEEALRISMLQSWNENAKAKLLFLLLDAPPHTSQENIHTIKKQIKLAQQKGIKIIPIVASDADKSVEFLMRYFSISTNGTYVFLTDDSGIGNSHIKPSTKDFKVEKLNDLIVRLIKEYTVAI